MAHMIDIKDSRNGALTATLSDILEAIGPTGKNLVWSIFHLWAVGDLGEGKDMVEFEQEISAAPNGFLLNLRKLNELSHKFDQIIDTVIVGALHRDSITKCQDEHKLYSMHDLVLDLFDGAYWRVYAKDESVIDELSRKFLDTECK